MRGNDVETVKGAVSIVDFIGQYVQLKREGAGYVGLCPFHEERTPSFKVNPNMGRFKCFGCGVGGDVFNFLQIRDGMSFPEALGAVADYAGVSLTQRVGGDKREFNALEAACKIFERNFVGSEAERYMREERGILPEVLQDFRVGFALNSWDYLLNTLAKEFDIGLLESVGLINKVRDQSGYYDFFRERVIFPIIDVTNRVVGFAGRTLKSDESVKYLNTKQGPTFNKSRLLYGLGSANRLLRDMKQLVIVEGYTDVLLCNQAGVKNVVGTGGTQLTVEQASLIEDRFGGLEVVLCFDGDVPGRGAAVRATERLLGRGNTKVCLLPDGEDPANLVKQGSDLKGILRDNSRSAFGWYVDERSAGLDLRSAEGITTFLKRVRDPLRGIPPEVMDLYIDVLANSTRISRESIIAHVFSTDLLISGNSVRSAFYLASRHDAPHWEGYLLRQLVVNATPEVIKRVASCIKLGHFSVPEARALFGYMIGNCDSGTLFDAVEAPLFASNQVDPILDRLVEESPSLCRDTLSLLVHGGALYGVTMESIEFGALMVKTTSIISKLGINFNSGDVSFEGLAGLLGDLEERLRNGEG